MSTDMDNLGWRYRYQSPDGQISVVLACDGDAMPPPFLDCHHEGTWVQLRSDFREANT
jgi:hypothetical protein